MLCETILSGNRLSLAKLITGIENGDEEALAALDALFPHSGRAHLIGVTGAPGTGKSSLVNQLARLYRHPPQGQLARRVGIVAVDPTSPFSGGALLGDRVRMRELSGDAGVFIRSMASRGTLGGLAATTSQVVAAMDAAGFEVILIETVGVGQSEIDIANLAHSVVVVEAPGLGDDIQAGKAGILEVADILVVNKADLSGAEHTHRILEQMLDIAYSRDDSSGSPAQNSWRPPVIKTIANQGTGIDDLFASLASHLTFIKNNDEWIKRSHQRLEIEFENLLRERVVYNWVNGAAKEKYHNLKQRVFNREISPVRAVEELLTLES
ncbi:MAG: methylmalonyl Co-A mutase-associated GTPase MeaB [Anaerolineae bacterium]|nr:methylmalonyl Co-A mutase-associated GTPase MeaB [Anaerolineae bacterium]